MSKAIVLLALFVIAIGVAAAMCCGILAAGPYVMP